MKYVVKGLFFLISFVIALVSLVMIFFEARLLISGDWLIYDNQFNAFIRYLFKLIIACSFLFVVLCEYIKPLREKSIIKKYLFDFEITLFVMSILFIFLSANIEGIIIFLLMLLFMVFKFVDYCLLKKQIM